MLLKIASKFCFRKNLSWKLLPIYSACNFFSQNLGDSTCNLKYLLILDFEATCDKPQIKEQEIIEFPCLKINLKTLEEESRFHKYVRPVIHPQLSLFCVRLTGILQEMVDDEDTFPEVLESFNKWRQEEGLTDKNSLYITSGDWDLGHMMPLQCKYNNLDVPQHMLEWIDIKKFYANNYGQYSNSLINILKAFNLEFVGRQHSGIDDCINIYNAVKKMATLGVQFEPTSKVIISEEGRKVVTLRPFIKETRNLIS